MNLSRTHSKAVENLATPADLLTLVEQGNINIYARFKCDNALATLQEGNEITGVAHGAVNGSLNLTPFGVNSAI